MRAFDAKNAHDPCVAGAGYSLRRMARAAVPQPLTAGCDPAAEGLLF
jgi:hypothetical protein